MQRRINVSLSDEALAALDRHAGQRARSRFIEQAVMDAIERAEDAEIDRLLAEGAEVHAARDLAIVKEWEALDVDGWGDEFVEKVERKREKKVEKRRAAR